MKTKEGGLWAVDAELRYVRMLSTCSASEAAKHVNDHRKDISTSQRKEQSLRRVLSKAYSLPTTWWCR